MDEFTNDDLHAAWEDFYGLDPIEDLADGIAKGRKMRRALGAAAAVGAAGAAAYGVRRAGGPKAVAGRARSAGAAAGRKASLHASNAKLHGAMAASNAGDRARSAASSVRGAARRATTSSGMRPVAGGRANVNVRRRPLKTSRVAPGRVGRVATNAVRGHRAKTPTGSYADVSRAVSGR